MVARLTGTKRFHAGGDKLDCDALSFRQWSCSDINGNALQGLDVGAWCDRVRHHVTEDRMDLRALLGAASGCTRSLIRALRIHATTRGPPTRHGRRAFRVRQLRASVQ
jgi:hypothetical protein